MFNTSNMKRFYFKNFTGATKQGLNKICLQNFFTQMSCKSRDESNKPTSFMIYNSDAIVTVY